MAARAILLDWAVMAFRPFFETGVWRAAAVVVLAGVNTTARGQPAEPSTRPAAVKYAPPSNPAVLHSTFVDWDSLSVQSTPTGQSRPVWNNPTPTLEKFEMHITTLRPGMMSHPVHRHPWEEMLLIKEGQAEVSVNGKKLHAGPGSLIFYASNDPHNIKNVGDVPATYYVINFGTDLVHAVPDEAAAEQAPAGKLASCVMDCNAMPATPTATGSTATIIESPTMTFRTLGSHITTLNAGQSTKPERVDAGDELFILKTGRLAVTINGVSCRLREGSFFYCAPNDKRTLVNIGAVPATYQVFRIVSDKTPKTAGE